MFDFLSGLETHLNLIVAIVSFLMAVLTILGSFLWHKFIIQDTVKRVALIETDMEDNSSKGIKTMSGLMDRVGNIETAMEFIKEDMRLIKEFIVGHGKK